MFSALRRAVFVGTTRGATERTAGRHRKAVTRGGIPQTDPPPVPSPHNDPLGRRSAPTTRREIPRPAARPPSAAPDPTRKTLPSSRRGSNFATPVTASTEARTWRPPLPNPIPRDPNLTPPQAYPNNRHQARPHPRTDPNPARPHPHTSHHRLPSPPPTSKTTKDTAAAPETGPGHHPKSSPPAHPRFARHPQPSSHPHPQTHSQPYAWPIGR